MKKVKTTKTELKQILKEEIKHILNETEEVPPMDELVEQAYASVFSNEIQQLAQRRANDRVRKASARRLGSGASVSSETMPMSADDPLENPVLKEFYENAMRENGTL